MEKLSFPHPKGWILLSWFKSSSPFSHIESLRECISLRVGGALWGLNKILTLEPGFCSLFWDPIKSPALGLMQPSQDHTPLLWASIPWYMNKGLFSWEFSPWLFLEQPSYLLNPLICQLRAVIQSFLYPDCFCGGGDLADRQSLIDEPQPGIMFY